MIPNLDVSPLFYNILVLIDHIHIIISICYLVRGSRPGEQLVTSEWRLTGSWLASSLGTIVVEVDGRGAGGQGLAWHQLLGTPALHLSCTLHTQSVTSNLPIISSNIISE